MTGLLMVHHGSEGGLGPANVGTPEFQGKSSSRLCVVSLLHTL